jgi:hypothetical protein
MAIELPKDDDILLDQSEALALLGKRCERTLKRWRELGTGPAYVRVGRAIYYRSGAIRQWLLGLEARP